MDQLCDTLGLKKSTVYKYTAKEQIPHIKIYNKIFFEEGAIKKWLAEKTVEVR
jgi:excisionase family DNA binding protein